MVFVKRINLTPYEAGLMNGEAAKRLAKDKDDFIINILKYAKETFERNFADKSFTDDTGKKVHWDSLSKFTKWRREHWYHTDPNNILVDTGTMKRSICIDKAGNRVYTDPISYMHRPTKDMDDHTKRRIRRQTKPRRHKGFVYAGVHNDPPSGTYHGTNTPFVKRQFMGHTAAVKNVLQRYEKLYLMKNLP